jgi:hypothetical protein
VNARTAEQATTDACRRYQLMLNQARRGNQLNTGIEADKFANAARLAEVLELRQIRKHLAHIDAVLTAGGPVGLLDAGQWRDQVSDDDATDKVAEGYDGFAVRP